jgi:2-polyprenyl-3-methyl-5-hydroxy-6-metoxy-1,4-benzoquinol methylase
MEDIQEKLDNLEKLIHKNSSDILDIKARLDMTNKQAAPVPHPSEFDRLVTLLNTPEWPNAVDPILIVDANSEQDKEDRADGILDLIIETSLKDKAFLDFGCGEGHVVKKSVSQNPKMAVGFDIAISNRWSSWEQKPNTFFTNNWEEVHKRGPYNVVLIYDVIDHILDPEPELVNKLKVVKSVCAPGAKIYVRCHPYTSRHANHLYRQLNKAFVHIIFTEEELKQLGYSGMPIRRVLFPISFYKRVFEAAGFRLIRKNPQISRETVEQFFQRPLIASRIMRNWKGTANESKMPLFQLELQFLDYLLE